MLDSLRLLFFRIVRNYYYCGMIFTRSCIEEFDRKGKVLLDAGAGTSQFKKHARHLTYLTQDISQNSTGSINYVCDLNQELPQIKTSSVDVILFTQVLEHLQEPTKVLNEFFRILKRKGKVFLTTNMCYEEHMIPNDYFRFTRYGLKYLGESTGFKIVSIKPQGGIFQVILYFLVNLPLFLFPKKQTVWYYIYFTILTPILIPVGLFVLVLDKLDKEKRLTLSYECIFQKL